MTYNVQRLLKSGVEYVSFLVTSLNIFSLFLKGYHPEQQILFCCFLWNSQHHCTLLWQFSFPLYISTSFHSDIFKCLTLYITSWYPLCLIIYSCFLCDSYPSVNAPNLICDRECYVHGCRRRRFAEQFGRPCPVLLTSKICDKIKPPDLIGPAINVHNTQIFWHFTT